MRGHPCSAGEQVPLTLRRPASAGCARVLALGGPIFLTADAALSRAARGSLDTQAMSGDEADRFAAEIESQSMDADFATLVVVEGDFEATAPTQRGKVTHAHVRATTLEDAELEVPELAARVAETERAAAALPSSPSGSHFETLALGAFPNEKGLDALLARVTIPERGARGGLETPNWSAMPALALAARRSPKLFQSRRAAIEVALARFEKADVVRDDHAMLACVVLGDCVELDKELDAAFGEATALPQFHVAGYQTYAWASDAATRLHAIDWLARRAAWRDKENVVLRTYVTRARRATPGKPSCWPAPGDVAIAPAAAAWRATTCAEEWTRAGDLLLVALPVESWVNGMPPTPRPTSGNVHANVRMTIANPTEAPLELEVGDATLSVKGATRPLVRWGPATIAVPPASLVFWEGGAGDSGSIDVDTKAEIRLAVRSSGASAEVRVPYRVSIAE